jgi:hypothetical protein
MVKAAVFIGFLSLAPLGVVGCRSDRCPDINVIIENAADLALNPARADEDVQAMVDPPVGWRAEALKVSARHRHQVWVSPTGATAYGVIYLNLPFPVGADLTLWGFLQQMQKTDGRADLISEESDDRLPGIRFVAVGERYTIRTNLTVSGFHAWAVYAGSRNDRAVNEDELAVAVRAREGTRLGLR